MDAEGAFKILGKEYLLLIDKTEEQTKAGFYLGSYNLKGLLGETLL
jgi:hypothetical protein